MNARACRGALTLLLLVLAACAQNGAGPAAGGTSPGAAGVAATPGDGKPSALYSMFHRPLKVPEGATEVLRLHGQGAIIFRCEEQPAGLRWAFRQPEAELRDAQGKVAVRHDAAKAFLHVDGSSLIVDIIDHVPAPEDNALPWLLMNAHAFGKGALATVTQVQRIDTVGGMPPPACESAKLNQLLRVPFSADFVFTH